MGGRDGEKDTHAVTEGGRQGMMAARIGFFSALLGNIIVIFAISYGYARVSFFPSDGRDGDDGGGWGEGEVPPPPRYCSALENNNINSCIPPSPPTDSASSPPSCRAYAIYRVPGISPDKFPSAVHNSWFLRRAQTVVKVSSAATSLSL